jgi:hypothetical protein
MAEFGPRGDVPERYTLGSSDAQITRLNYSPCCTMVAGSNAARPCRWHCRRAAGGRFSGAGDLSGMKMTAMPDTVKTGRITIHATNQSKALVHEVLVVRPPATALRCRMTTRRARWWRSESRVSAKYPIWRRASPAR